MPAVILGVAEPSAPQNNSRYVTPGTSTGGVTNTVESRAQVRSPAGTWSALSVNIISYFGGGNTLTAALRVNGAQSALVVSCPAGVTGRFENLVDTVDVDDGDLVALRFQGSAAPYSNTSGPASVNFEPAGDSPEVWYVGDSYLTQTGQGRVFMRPFGSGSTAIAEADSNMQLARAAGVLTHLRVNVATNAKAGASSLTLRKNGADTALTVAIPASTTGNFEDLTHSVDVASGDVFSYALDLAAVSGNFAVGQASMRFTGSEGGYDLFAGATGAGINIAAGTNYGHPLGSLIFSDASARRALRFNAPAVLSNLRCQVSSSLGALTLTSGINGAAGNLTISTAGGTGYFEDVTNTDSVVAGDEVTLRAVAAAGNTVWYHAMTVTTTTPGPVEIDVPGGVLEIVGRTPIIGPPEEVDVPGGVLEIVGRAPVLTSGIVANVPPGDLEIVGSAPGIFTETAAIGSEAAVVALAEIVPAARASQAAVTILAEINPAARASEAAVIVLGDGSPCVTERCQIWTITRRDGVVFRYTSHDQDVRYGGQVYRACRSLNPSASENASTLGSVGNIELEGIIDDDGISEEDLYGGLFDDAYVTVDLISWGSIAEAPRRLASGWTGELSQGNSGFRMEVLGAGARLGQQALVQMVTPGCRWTFGDSRCGVDVEALAIGGTVIAAATRSRFTALLDAGDGGLQWANGRVRWTSGRNAGHVLEVKEVDFDAGVVTLWPSSAYLPEAGDLFELLPGCDKARDGGCTVYANIINFGGFPDVPGSDAILETPDAKY